MTDHTEYDYVDEMSMDQCNENCEGIYMMPFEMDSERCTENEYIDVINDPQLCESVQQTKADDVKKNTESDSIEMYTSLRSPSTHKQRRGNYQNLHKNLN